MTIISILANVQLVSFLLVTCILCPYLTPKKLMNQRLSKFHVLNEYRMLLLLPTQFLRELNSGFDDFPFPGPFSGVTSKWEQHIWNLTNWNLNVKLERSLRYSAKLFEQNYLKMVFLLYHFVFWRYTTKRDITDFCPWQFLDNIVFAICWFQNSWRIHPCLYVDKKFYWNFQIMFVLSGLVQECKNYVLTNLVHLP